MTSTNLWLNLPRESWCLTQLHDVEFQDLSLGATCFICIVVLCWMVLFSPLIHAVYSLIVSDSIVTIFVECLLLTIFYMILIVRFIILLKRSKRYPSLALRIKSSARYTIAKRVCQSCRCMTRLCFRMCKVEPGYWYELELVIFLAFAYGCIASFTVIMIPFTNDLTSPFSRFYGRSSYERYLKPLRNKFGELGCYIEYMCQNANPDHSEILRNMNDAHHEFFGLLTKYAINLQIYKARTTRLYHLKAKDKTFGSFEQFCNRIISRQKIDYGDELSVTNANTSHDYVEFMQESLLADIIATIGMIIVQYCICIFSELKFIVPGINYNDNYWIVMIITIIMSFILHIVLIVTTQMIPKWKTAQMNKYLILNLDRKIRVDTMINIRYSIGYKDIMRSYVTQTFIIIEDYQVTLNFNCIVTAYHILLI